MFTCKSDRVTRYFIITPKVPFVHYILYSYQSSIVHSNITPPGSNSLSRPIMWRPKPCTYAKTAQPAQKPYPTYAKSAGHAQKPYPTCAKAVNIRKAISNVRKWTFPSVRIRVKRHARPWKIKVPTNWSWLEKAIKVTAPISLEDLMVQELTVSLDNGDMCNFFVRKIQPMRIRLAFSKKIAFWTI